MGDSALHILLFPSREHPMYSIGVVVTFLAHGLSSVRNGL
jgi:hypothetical protein